MKRIGRRASFLALVIAFFIICTGFFIGDYAANAKKWVVYPANQNIYSNGQLKGTGSVVSSDGVNLLTLDSNGTNYAESKTLRMATLHAVGDLDDSINTGVMKTDKYKLIGYDLLNGVYSPTESGSTVNLTIDSEVSKAAYEALGDNKGTVGIYNYKTGEILCMVSKPSFDPMDVPNDMSGDAYEGVYVNRLTGGLYTPGSVFKIITTQAAIEEIPDIYSQTFHCDGGITIDGEWIACNGNHGTIGFEDAFANSCNAAYAEIATQLGDETLTKYVESAGVTSRFSVNGVNTSTGRFNVSGVDDVSLSWAGIGQYTDMVNPMQMMIYMGAIADGGKAVTPYYVSSSRFSGGLSQMFRFGTSTESRMVSESTAEKLQSMMRYNVTSVYGESGFEGMELCAKTGTAQVDDGASHAWLTGFLANEDTPLAFVVVVEHGGGGQSAAMPVARTALNEAVKTFD